MMRSLSKEPYPWVLWAQRCPQQQALITTEATYNWAQIETLIEHYVLILSRQGLSEGDVLTIAGKNQSEVVVAYLAALQLRIICAFVMPQPVNRLLEKLTALYGEDGETGKKNAAKLWLLDGVCYSESEIEQCQAQLISIPKIDQVMEVIENSERESSTSTFVADSPSITDRLFVTDRPFAIDRTSNSEQTLATIVFTSGSTGAPKAVAHTFQQHLYSAEGLLDVFRYTDQDSWLLSLPMYHVSGLAIVHRWLVAGGCIKVGSGLLNQDIEGCTHASLVATQLQRLLMSKQSLSLTHVLLGGSHIPNQLATQAQKLGIETWLGYGMTEAASTVTAKQVDSSNTAGFVLNHRALKISENRISIGGQTLASGYYYQGKVTPLVDKSGWFDSKDLGVWVNEHVSIIGRADNQFISGGENIHCEEIEAILNRHPHIIQAMIVPVSDSEFGHRPVAIIQSKNELSAECDQKNIEQWLDGSLEKFKWPIAYYHMPEELLNSGIKVSRSALKHWLTKKLTK